MIGRCALLAALIGAGLNCEQPHAPPEFFRPDTVRFYPALATAAADLTCRVLGLGTASPQTDGCLYTAPTGTLGTARVVTCPANPSAGIASPCDTSRTISYGGSSVVLRGLAAGFWNYPTGSAWCDGWTSGTTRPFPTSSLLGYLQDARRCNMRLFLVPPHRYLSTNGTNTGSFSLDSAKAFTDRMAKILTPDTLRKYEPWIAGFNLSDDYNSTEKWGGTPVTPAQIEAWAVYVRGKIPGLRIGVRVTPDWVTSSLASRVDYAWAQYHTGRGEVKAYFDKAVASAKAKGLAIGLGVNVEDCAGNGSPSCTPQQIRDFMGLAVSYPEACAALGWTYEATTLAQSGMRAAWDDVLSAAKQHPDVPCRHA